MTPSDDAASPRRVRETLVEATERFCFSPTPRLDAELLMAHALGVPREELLLRHLDDPTPASFTALSDRRAAQEPIAYVVGIRAFWTIDLHVGPGVLIPRADSETLIEAAVAHFAGTPGPRTILDLGTGPGTLLLAALAEWPDARGLGVDTSLDAEAYFCRNASALDLASRARFTRGNWAEQVTDSFDLVLCNPPYIADAEALPAEVARYEPAAALFAGAEGLDAYRALAPQLPRLIASDGAACIEIGWTQAAQVCALIRAEGLHVAVRQDLAGRDRCLVATA